LVLASTFIVSFAVVYQVNIAVQIIFALTTVGVSAVFFYWKKAPQPSSASFRCPWVPFTPLAGIYANVYMMANLNGPTWIRLLVWLLIGLVIFFSYSIRNSKLSNEHDNPLSSLNTNNNNHNSSRFVPLQEETNSDGHNNGTPTATTTTTAADDLPHSAGISENPSIVSLEEIETNTYVTR